MADQRSAQETARRLRAVKPWLRIEDRGVRAHDVDTGLLLPEQLFAVVVLWDVTASGSAWIGWLTSVGHQSVCFCAADLREGQFRAWLAQLPGWEPARLERAIETPGLHLVWRRHVD